MENFPQAGQALSNLQSSTGVLSTAIQSGYQSPPQQVRLSDSAKKVKEILEFMSNQKSSFEDEDEDQYLAEGVKKRALNSLSGGISTSLDHLAQSLQYAHEPFPDHIASELKSVLEEYEKVQSSFEKLAKDNDATANNFSPGILSFLTEKVDNAYQKLGGR